MMGLWKAIGGAVAFGVSDAVCFLVAEETLQSTFQSIYGFDRNMATLSTGGVSAAISMVIAALVKLLPTHFHRKYNKVNVNGIFVDAVGVIVGTLVVLGLYKLFSSNKKIR